MITQQLVEEIGCNTDSNHNKVILTFAYTANITRLVIDQLVRH